MSKRGIQFQPKSNVEIQNETISSLKHSTWLDYRLQMGVK